MQRSSANPSTENERRLAEIDALIRNGRDDIDAQIERANLLNLLDRQTESLDLFIEIVKRSPTNFRVLNEFGQSLVVDGIRGGSLPCLYGGNKAAPGKPDRAREFGQFALAGRKLGGGEKGITKVCFILIRATPKQTRAWAPCFLRQGIETVQGAISK